MVDQLPELYCTTYCNKPHRVRDGMPVNHECRVLPHEVLKAEIDGDYTLAQQLLGKASTRISKGIKL